MRVSGDLQTDSGTPFDPAPQFVVERRDASSSRVLHGRCFFGPVRVGTVFDLRAGQIDDGWESTPLTSPLTVESAEIYDGVFVDEIGQTYTARVHFDLAIEDVRDGDLLIASASSYADGWRRGDKLWERT